jgi:predicted metallopeptidase
MPDVRKVNEEYAVIGRSLIENEEVLEYIKDSEATIIYLSSEQAKTQNGKIIFAQCEKVAEKYKWGIPCDFTITVFEPNCEDLTPDQLRILIFHELLHIGIDFNSSGQEVFKINPHDLEDFKYIIDRFGTDWISGSEGEEFTL